MKGIFEAIPADSHLRRYGKFLVVNRNGYSPAEVNRDIPTDVQYITDEDADELEALTRREGQDWEIK